MLTVARVLVGSLLAAHGLVHLLYLTPDAENTDYPFTLKDSWLVSEKAGRPMAIVLTAATVGGFVLVAMAIWNVPGLASLWPAVAIVAAGVSLALLAVFWDARLLFGVAVDLALIVVAVTRPGWADRLAG